MIKIERTAAPAFLQSEKVIAAKEKIRKNFENAHRQERFKFDVSLLGQLKDELLQMCNEKCAYCESSLGVASKGDVENFRPKAGARGIGGEYATYHYWWLAYEWDNLLVTCQICNQKYKRDHFPLEKGAARAPIGAVSADLLLEKAMLIDPTIEDPGLHLNFFENGTVIEKTKRGKCSIDVLGLNREELVHKRKEAADSFMMRLKLMAFEETQELKKTVEYIEHLHSDHPRQEYAATLRAVFAGWLTKNKSLWEKLINQFKNAGNELANVTLKTNIKPTVYSITENEKKEITDHLAFIRRFSIKSIEIQNFRSIDNISLHIGPTGSIENRESWLLILGDNGIGKSSLLQAIALALAGQKQLDLLKLDVVDYLKYNTTGGFVKIQSYEHDKPVILQFDASGFKTELQEPPTFLLAYGSTRLLPKGGVQPDPIPQEYINVANLFDYSVALCNPHVWLKAMDQKEFRDRVAPAFFDVLALRGKDRLYIQNGEITIEQNGMSNPLDDNSDGYKTVVALVTDIMKTLSIDQAGYHNSQGIVLIDEIGNHLHPRWRMKIVSALRRAFPHLQFIVTTHEPLCLRGLAHGEVAVLVRDHDKRIRALEKELLPDHSLMRVEQLLTSDLFGLINVLDEEAEKTYEEYYQLLAKQDEEKTDNDRTKIKEMTAMIDENEVLGTRTDEQVMYKVINDTFAKKIRDEGFKTKEELKKETVEEVKNFIKNKRYDWL